MNSEDLEKKAEGFSAEENNENGREGYRSYGNKNYRPDSDQKDSVQHCTLRSVHSAPTSHVSTITQVDTVLVRTTATSHVSTITTEAIVHVSVTATSHARIMVEEAISSVHTDRTTTDKIATDKIATDRTTTDIPATDSVHARTIVHVPMTMIQMQSTA